jgi:hypothetical protein
MAASTAKCRPGVMRKRSSETTGDGVSKGAARKGDALCRVPGDQPRRRIRRLHGFIESIVPRRGRDLVDVLAALDRGGELDAHCDAAYGVAAAGHLVRGSMCAEVGRSLVFSTQQGEELASAAGQ